MIRHRLLFLAIAGVLFTTACNIKGNRQEGALQPKPIHGIKVKLAALALTKDPICAMPLKDGEIEDTTVYNGKIYGFCNTGCKAEFIKEPEKYLNQK